MSFKMKNPITDGLTVSDIKKVIAVLEGMDQRSADSQLDCLPDSANDREYREYLKGYCAGIRAGIHEIKTRRRVD